VDRGLLVRACPLWPLPPVYFAISKWEIARSASKPLRGGRRHGLDSHTHPYTNTNTNTNTVSPLAMVFTYARKVLYKQECSTAHLLAESSKDPVYKAHHCGGWVSIAPPQTHNMSVRPFTWHASITRHAASSHCWRRPTPWRRRRRARNRDRSGKAASSVRRALAAAAMPRR
jgi:hypothetical protein